MDYLIIARYFNACPELTFIRCKALSLHVLGATHLQQGVSLAQVLELLILEQPNPLISYEREVED